jgi:hypothetical protein
MRKPLRQSIWNAVLIGAIAITTCSLSLSDAADAQSKGSFRIEPGFLNEPKTIDSNKVDLHYLLSDGSQIDVSVWRSASDSIERIKIFEGSKSLEIQGNELGTIPNPLIGEILLTPETLPEGTAITLMIPYFDNFPLPEPQSAKLMYIFITDMKTFKIVK